MWDEQTIRELLGRVAQGQQSIDEAMASLRGMPYEDAGGFAKLDHHRSLRQGFPEVVFCAGKTVPQVAEIASRLAKHHNRILGTRASVEQYEAARKLVPDLQYHELARAIWLDREPDRPRRPGIVLVAAGTSDLPVAEEAALTLRLMGHAPEQTYDVGVAGLHRLLYHVPTIQAAMS
jgi:NCAIR mutase (PurE)-related protein